VLFRFDKSSLTPKAKAILGSVAQQIKSRARGTVQITGYTDSIGTDAVNIPLSQARARSVVTALTPLTPGVNYSATGKGSADPVAPNTLPDGADNPAGRALNRRVTIVFTATPVHPAPPVHTGAAARPAGQSASMTFPAWSAGNDSYRASGVSLRRYGNLVVLNMTLTCAAGVSHPCVPLFSLAGIPTVPPLQVFTSGSDSFDSQAANSISGFSLLDPATGAQYIPVHRTDNVPLTSTLGQSIPQGDSYQVWSYYAAPPLSTTALTLVSPGPGASPRLGPMSISDSATP